MRPETGEQKSHLEDKLSIRASVQLFLLYFLIFALQALCLASLSISLEPRSLRDLPCPSIYQNVFPFSLPSMVIAADRSDAFILSIHDADTGEKPRGRQRAKRNLSARAIPKGDKFQFLSTHCPLRCGFVSDQAKGKYFLPEARAEPRDVKLRINSPDCYRRDATSLTSWLSACHSPHRKALFLL